MAAINMPAAMQSSQVQEQFPHDTTFEEKISLLVDLMEGFDVSGAEKALIEYQIDVFEPIHPENDASDEPMSIYERAQSAFENHTMPNFKTQFQPMMDMLMTNPSLGRDIKG